MKLCVIPARGGSKRIPHKNIKSFLGKPIMEYSIKAALDSMCFDHVIVSTDDTEIADVAVSCGAEVPFMRPENLANDYASTLSVIKHAVEWYATCGQELSYVCCIYATAPFVTAELIQSTFKQLKSTKAEYCFTVTNYPFPIQRAIRLTNQKRVEMFHPELFETRSQDLEEAYHDAGQLYWGTANAFKEMTPLFSQAASPFVLPSYLVQDIDTVDDWLRAELMYQSLHERLNQ